LNGLSLLVCGASDCDSDLLLSLLLAVMLDYPACPKGAAQGIKHFFAMPDNLILVHPIVPLEHEIIIYSYIH
jgi:hypothetical protein